MCSRQGPGMFAGRSVPFLPQNQLTAMLQLISLSTFGLPILFTLFMSPRAGTELGKAKRFGAGRVPSQQFPGSWSSIPYPVCPVVQAGQLPIIYPIPIPQISLKPPQSAEASTGQFSFPT